jgi:tellurite resistance protein TerC
MNPVLRESLKKAKKIVVLIVGSAVLLIGIVMLVLPGPAILVIPLGLGILAMEFEWARRWLNTARKKFSEWRKSRR